MAEAARTFRVFVSSTFKDLEAERNILQEQVFPYLKELCRSRGHRFQDIDLRWGVSEEASLDQQALNICLGEIKRCREITPRPNFIVLLGNRYGWLAPPPQIPADQFVQIRDNVPPGDQDELGSWYAKDDNADPPEYYLRPREKGGPYERYEGWEPVEQRLHGILARGVRGTPLEADPRFSASATEQEILAGAVRIGGPEEHAFAFIRELQPPYPDPTKALKGDPILEFLDPDQAWPEQREETPLGKLKAKLEAELPVQTYRARWDAQAQRPATDHLDDLAWDVREALEWAILDEIDHPSPPVRRSTEPDRIQAHDALDADGQAHRDFAEERCQIFVGREDSLAAIARYLTGSDPRPLVISGEGGTGKSALLAEALRRAQRDHLGSELMYRFIGTTPGSSDGRSLLDGLCRELARRGYGEGESSVPADYQELFADFRTRLGAVGTRQPLILFLDSLDQLSASQGARGLAWLPTPVPDGVRMVVSTRPGDTLETMARRGVPVEEPGPMRQADGEELLRRWLKTASRSLEPQGYQERAVLAKFQASGGNPLYLRLAFEQARRWKRDQAPEDLATGVEGIIAGNTYGWLAEQDNHGEVLVSHALGYLAASRRGLGEDELLDLLSCDVEVYRWFLRGTYHLPPDVVKAAARYGQGEDSQRARRWLLELKDDDARQSELDEFLAALLPARDGVRLPVVLWSRLFADLRPYLSERSAEGATLIAFYHRELEQVAHRAYLTGDEYACHLRLAGYFRRQADPGDDHTWTGASVRGLSELPYHLTQGAGTDHERWQDLLDTLTDFRFLERKAAEVGVVNRFRRVRIERGPRISHGKDERTVHTGVFSLQDDYELALAKLGGGSTTRKPLIVTGVNLGQGPVIRCPWCNQGSPFQEDWRGSDIACPNRDCNGPLHVNTFLVGEVAPRAALAMTAQTTPSTETNDRQTTLEAFARALRRELYTLAEWPELTWQQLYNRLQWEGDAVIERLADVRRRRSRPGGRPWMHRYSRLRESGALVRILTGHTAFVAGCAVSPDGSWIVSAGEDHTLKIWDSDTGGERTTLTGHTALVNGCAVSHDGAIVVSAGGDSTLKIWDVATGTEQATLIGHSNQVNACALSPDGTWIVSASDDRTLKIWDIATESERATLRGHTDLVRGCAISPDGTWIVSCSNDRTLRIWDAATGALRTTLIGHADEVRGCAVSPDGAWIVSASRDRTLKIWDVASGAERATLDGHTDQAHGCAVSPDGTWIVSASRDHSLKIWDTVTGAELSTLTGHTGYVVGCAVSPDGAWIVSAATDHALNIWDTAIDGQRNVATGHKSAVYGCAVSPDGSWIVSSSWDRTLKIWDAASGCERRTLTGHVGVVRGCAVSPDSAWIVSASHDRTLSIWDAATGAERAALTGHTDSVRGCAISPDGTWIASASNDRTLKIWDAASGAERAALTGHTDSVSGCAISPDGAWIVSASRDGTLKIWDAASGAERAALTRHSYGVSACAMSPDGTWIVSASGNELKIWDVATGRERTTLTGHTEWVNSCAVSPDGAWIVSAGSDHTIRIWDAATGAERAVLVLPGAAYAVAFHPFAPMVACGDRGGNVHLAQLVGIDLGPLVTTAAMCRHDLTVRCPACRAVFSIDRDRIGTETECPASVCATPLRVNPFVFQPLPSHVGLRRWFGRR